MNKTEKKPRAKAPGESVDIWNLPEPPVEEGRFRADWESLSAYEVPGWFRDSKLGFWSHWDPQSVPEEGDWYARWMYDEHHKDNAYHREHYGSPAEFGYKDICGIFYAEAFDPEDLSELICKAGGRYLLCLANHHDNFDNFDSRYQPWNSVNIGAFRDIVGDWFKAGRKRGLKVGVSYHATPGRVWGQFMPVRYGEEFPGDGTLTKEDGKGRWWEGYDPKDLYGPVHSIEDDPLKSPFANQFLNRVHDLMKYQPDLVVFDESTGNLRDLGAKMGLGVHALAPKLLAHYYNLCEKWHGKADGIMTMKDIGGRYNSVADFSLHPLLHQAFVNGIEKGTEDEIAEYPFQTEDSLAEWHYQKGMEYKTAPYILWQLADVVSRNGNLVICIPQHGDGSIDPKSRQICEEIGAWLSVNGEAIYSTRPYAVYGEGDVRYTRKNGVIYAIVKEDGEADLSLSNLGKNSITCGEILGIMRLGSKEKVEYVQEETFLSIKRNGKSEERMPVVYKIESSKRFINDDDGEISYEGWQHVYQKEQGYYNNDLHIAKYLGASAKITVEGKHLEVYAAKGPFYGMLEIRLDGRRYGEASLYDKEPSSFVKVFDRPLPEGEHVLEILSAHGSPANLDALVIS